MNDSYYNYDLPVQTLISKKFKLKPILKKIHKKYYLIKLTLFIKKIWNHEPNLVIIISQIHNYNYSTVVNLSSLKFRRPIRMNACLGYFDFKDNINNSDSESDDERLYGCHCQSCDIYGSYLLKPYRIPKKKFYKMMQKN